jgi:S-formylglutathione hydrolase
MEKPVCVSKTKCFDGWLEFYQHESSSVAGEMKFSVFLPASASTQKLPVLYFLGGLENSEENFMMKSGAQRVAASQNIILVCPDTSPRRAGVAG